MRKLFFILLTLVSSFASSAISFKSEGYIFNILDETNHYVSIYSYQTRSGMYEIPSKVEYEGTCYTVTEIAPYAFEGSINLDIIIIPETVTRVGRDAFTGTSAQTIIIGKNVKSVEGSSSSIECIKAIWLSDEVPDGFDVIKPKYYYCPDTDMYFQAIRDIKGSNLRYYMYNLLDNITGSALISDGWVYITAEDGLILVGRDKSMLLSEFICDTALINGSEIPIVRLTTDALGDLSDIKKIIIDPKHECTVDYRFLCSNDALNFDCIYIGPNVMLGDVSYSMINATIENLTVLSKFNINTGDATFGYSKVSYYDNMLKISGDFTRSEQLTIGASVESIESGLASTTIILEPSTVPLTAHGDEYWGHALSCQNIVIGRPLLFSNSYIGPWSKTYNSITFNGECNTVWEDAFSGFKKISQITFEENVTLLKANAFHDSEEINEIHSLSPIPPTCEKGVFENCNFETCRLYVPEESIEAYREADVWKNFRFINDTDSSPVITVDPSQITTVLYDLQGRKIVSPTHGPYIRSDIYPDGTSKRQLTM